tara:strand:+ start:3671 stop:3826 length:156 start_codon:yes stop_codon:yes gene_type:complete
MKENRNIERGLEMKVVFNKPKKLQIRELETNVAILEMKLRMANDIIKNLEK